MSESTIPPLPLPRADLPPDGDDYSEYLDALREEPVSIWRTSDGTIHSMDTPRSMAPAHVMADGPISIAPDDPDYNTWLARVPREYDFMEPTPVEPQPRTAEEATPDAAGTDDAAQAG
jgi:hypothetical protein